MYFEKLDRTVHIPNFPIGKLPVLSIFVLGLPMALLLHELRRNAKMNFRKYEFPNGHVYFRRRIKDLCTELRIHRERLINSAHGLRSLGLLNFKCEGRSVGYIWRLHDSRIELFDLFCRARYAQVVRGDSQALEGLYSCFPKWIGHFLDFDAREYIGQATHVSLLSGKN